MNAPSRYRYRYLCSDCGDLFNTGTEGRTRCDWCAHIRGPYHPPSPLSHGSKLDVSPSFENVERAYEEMDHEHHG